MLDVRQSYRKRRARMTAYAKAQQILDNAVKLAMMDTCDECGRKCPRDDNALITVCTSCKGNDDE